MTPQLKTVTFSIVKLTGFYVFLMVIFINDFKRKKSLLCAIVLDTAGQEEFSAMREQYMRVSSKMS
jgi:GTPase SAR1 family protein